MLVDRLERSFLKCERQTANVESPRLSDAINFLDVRDVNFGRKLLAYFRSFRDGGNTLPGWVFTRPQPVNTPGRTRVFGQRGIQEDAS